jgi:hypothetical protein
MHLLTQGLELSSLPLKRALNVGDETLRKDDIRNIKEWMEDAMLKSVLKK